MTDTSREAVEEALRMNLAALSGDVLPAIKVCVDPKCVAVQCILDRLVRALLDEREALLSLALHATNGWACTARTQREHREISRLHREIRAVTARETVPPTDHL